MRSVNFMSVWIKRFLDNDRNWLGHIHEVGLRWRSVASGQAASLNSRPRTSFILLYYIHIDEVGLGCCFGAITYSLKLELGWGWVKPAPCTSARFGPLNFALGICVFRPDPQT